MEVSPVSKSLLVSCVKDKMLDGGSFLIVDKAQVVCILSNLSKDHVGVSKTITNTHSLQSS